MWANLSAILLPFSTHTSKNNGEGDFTEITLNLIAVDFVAEAISFVRDVITTLLLDYTASEQ